MEHDTADDVAPQLPGPPYPEQPLDGERPVPLRGIPDRTQSPDDWDVDAPESTRTRPVDDVAARREDDQASTRARTAEQGDDDRDAATDAAQESAYSTEAEQGASQPGPRDGER
jgi:hypothetical protein